MTGGVVAACSVPQPPALLPGMTGHPVAEVERLRAACLAAIGSVLRAGPDHVVLVGAISAADRAAGSAAEPLSLRVGRALLAEAGCDLPVEAVLVDAAAEAARCVEVGRAWAAATARVAMVVMADGSACRTVKAPGFLDDRAAGFDDAVLAALTGRDWRSIAQLDSGLAAELLVGGRCAWQVLAGALSEREDVSTVLHYAADPFGVFYPVLEFTLPD